MHFLLLLFLTILSNKLCLAEFDHNLQIVPKNKPQGNSANQDAAVQGQQIEKVIAEDTSSVASPPVITNNLSGKDLINTLSQQIDEMNSITKADEVKNNSTNGNQGQLINLDDMQMQSNKNKNKILIKIKDIKDSEIGHAENYMQSAYRAINDNSYEVALYFYKKALKLNNKSTDAMFGLAVAYQLLLQIDQAIDNYKKIIKITQQKQPDIKIINNLLIAIASKNTNDALEILLSVNKMSPDNYLILGQIGASYLKVGDFDKAVAFLTRATELSKDNAGYAYNLGIAYDAMKNYEYARYYYQYSLEHGLISQVSNHEIKILKNRLHDLDQKIKTDTSSQSNLEKKNTLNINDNNKNYNFNNSLERK